MSDRERILAALRRQPPPPPSPPRGGVWQRFDDPAARFASVLADVGGACVRVANREAIAAALAALPAWAEAARVYSALPGVRGRGASAIADAHAAANLDGALLRGRFAVAENAAVWVSEEDVAQRSLFFLPQHVALAVPASEMVHNMHEAYQRLALFRRGFGCFISGPSKTADIEQALVIGAHGPRSLTVFLVDGEL